MQYEELPAYEIGSAIKGIIEVLDRGRIVVKMLDDSLAIYTPPRVELRDLSWQMTSDYLKAWLISSSTRKSYPDYLYEFLLKLCNDSRMRFFWEWLPKVKFRKTAAGNNSHSVAMQVWQSTRMPNKPGNIPPAQRNAYFTKIRKHAAALRKLLEDTMFDESHMEKLNDEELNKTLDNKLYNWGVEESDEGHVVAFRVMRDGVYQYHWTYPESELTATLAYLEEWTYWDDQWDGSFFSSSAPIAQANSDSVKAVYFNCMLFEWFERRGIEIPFSILATIANVALDIEPDKQLDEDAVRKQVRRYQSRRAKQAESDGTSPGQNFTNWDDSVLSEPF